MAVCGRRRLLVLTAVLYALVLWWARDGPHKSKLSDGAAASDRPQTAQAPETSLLELSRNFRLPPSNVTAAVCLRTIFGGPNGSIMEWVLRWVAYNRLLGFDEILVWYVQDFMPPGFELLKTLPYVTLVENKRSRHPSEIMTQKEDIAECLNLTKNQFDWVFLIDADEFLWFDEKIRLKDFLLKHNDKKYLSFGKWFYEPQSPYSDAESNLFGLEKYPYTYKSYCWNDRQNKLCPGWLGRSKVMFRRDSFDHMLIHGIEHFLSKGRPCFADRCHFNTDVAHLKEWRHLDNLTTGCT